MEQLLHSWFEQQSNLICGACRAIVMLAVNDNGQFSEVAHWPTQKPASPILKIAALKAVITHEKIAKAGGVTEVFDTDDECMLVYPLVSKGVVLGVIAVELEAQSDMPKREILSLLRAGSIYLNTLLEQQHDESRGCLARILELVTLTLEQPHFHSAATSLATQLANELSCSRVSIGFMRGRFVTVRALSHSAKQNVKTSLLRAISAAMEEAIDQDVVLVYPGKEHICMEHRKLTEQSSVKSVCTIPLVSNDVTVGAITFERSNNARFDSDTIELYSQVANLIGPILELKRINDCWPIVRVLMSIGGFMKKLFGPRHVSLKAGALLLSLLALYLGFSTALYRVTAPAELEGSIQRVVVAPIDGFIQESNTRAGDMVQAGQLMGSLDDRELRLEQQRIISEKARYSREYRSAMAMHDRAQVSILSAQISQSDARLQLINKQLERMQIHAPFAGVVVSGDLSQSLGSPVTRGDILFEVAPLEGYRLVLKIDERDMHHVAVAQQGRLKLSGFPGDPMNFSISRITPVSETVDGANYFRVEAKLDSAQDILRPGMSGVGKIEVGERRQLWIWTHRMIDWLKIQAWSWWP